VAVSFNGGGKWSAIFGGYHFFCFGVMPIVLLKLTIFQVTVQ
jgi:hypothetical protein